MVDILFLLQMITSAGVFVVAGILVGAVYYFLHIRNQNKVRRTDLVTKLYATDGSIDRRRGAHQELETLINEEAFLFAQYLRQERQVWNPRIPDLTIEKGGCLPQCEI